MKKLALPISDGSRKAEELFEMATVWRAARETVFSEHGFMVRHYPYMFVNSRASL